MAVASRFFSVTSIVIKFGGSHVGEGISRMAKQELLVTLRERYRSSSKKDKSRILDEFIAITGR